MNIEIKLNNITGTVYSKLRSRMQGMVKKYDGSKENSKEATYLSGKTYSQYNFFVLLWNAGGNLSF